MNWIIDPDTFGLACYYSGNMPNLFGCGDLATNAIIIIIGPAVLEIPWKP